MISNGDSDGDCNDAENGALHAPIIAVGGVYKVINTNVSMTPDHRSWSGAHPLALVLVLFLCVMPKFRILQKMVDRVNLVTREILTGLSVIRAFHTEKHEGGAVLM
ncbi:MAG: hypothetical protein ACLUUO_02760 [Sellimonas intestinalis]